MAENKGSMKFVVILTVVVIGLIAAFVVLDNNSNSGENDTVSSGGDAPAIDGQPTIGESDAPVEIVEFGDYLCPACKVWSDQAFPLVKQDYIDTGDVNFTYINVLFHGEDSELASSAGEAVYKQDSEAFWDFSKALYEAQPEEHQEGWLTKEKIIEVAEESVPSIDTEKMNEDMDSEEIQQEVGKDDNLVKEHGVQVTPTIMINGEMVEDPFNYEEISTKIEKAIEESNE
ncbi:disulfide bond formation protein D [Thalassobacillus devorans]|uniref:Disulfide bond formation protein D n=1 Tax=Thalassobacillus devorans TaxID=279813 RepID=A0ABQ1PFC1_9BACI|nr:DsbA family protein [Thalassobacillus devorans]NIK29375.1 protein-disulfide isomerase [Thalassobacillus devorans]GGC96185.1 disulfide bond formation protein D [Thalassobacillus devorans]